MVGRIFDIKEMTVQDGKGIRVTVFMKGCPLSCEWCHNPEGLKYAKQLFFKRVKCARCGLCYKPCSHAECQPFGRCVHICPNDCLSVVGEDVDSGKLAERLTRYKPIFERLQGGVTFSGGEPLMQWAFLLEIIQKLKENGINDIAIETCGYAETEIFQKVAREVSLVIMDIKVFDRDRHIHYTKKDNELIKRNFLWLKSSGIPHLIRTPLIVGKTDDEENLKAIQDFVGDSIWEKLPENTLAEIKYNLLKID